MNYVIDTLANYMPVDQDAVVVDVENSHGSWVRDFDGKKYLDMYSQFASQPLGWNNIDLVEMKPRFEHVLLHKMANSDMYCSEYADFVRAWANITHDFKYHFFIEGGALAVENALKAAFDWKVQRDGVKTQDLDVVHFREAFHGRTGYTMSVTNNPHNDHKVKFYPKFNWTRVTNPKLYHPVDENKVEKLETISLEEIEKAMKKGNVACVLMEAIQGEGGDNHFRAVYLQKVQELCRKYNALFIIDEVQAGMGLTGRVWSYQNFGIKPDIIAFGKKSQVCGCSAGERLDEVPNNVFRLAGRINSTWGGNIVDMVRCSAIMEIMARRHLVSNAKRVGEYFLDRLTQVGYPNTRGKGLMIAFDLDDEKERDDMLGRLKEKGLLALSCGQKSIRFRPFLTMMEDEADQAIEMIVKAS